jgi:hypothetical protein
LQHQQFHLQQEQQQYFNGKNCFKIRNDLRFFPLNLKTLS